MTPDAIPGSVKCEWLANTEGQRKGLPDRLLPRLGQIAKRSNLEQHELVIRVRSQFSVRMSHREFRFGRAMVLPSGFDRYQPGIFPFLASFCYDHFTSAVGLSPYQVAGILLLTAAKYAN